jgi:hypothetical protein
MTTHTLTIDTSHAQTPLPNLSFSPWLRSQTTLFISQIVAILGFISLLASLIYYVSHISEQSEFLRHATSVKLIIDFIHVAFMTVFTLVLIQVLDDNERGSYHTQLVHERVFNLPPQDYETSLKRSKDQLRIFKRRFLWFWIGMLFLYVSFACQHSYKLLTDLREQSARSIEFSVVTRNEGSNGKEEYSRIEFNSRVTEETKPSNSDSPSTKLLGPIKPLVFPFFTLLFNTLTTLFIFFCFLVMYLPPDEVGKKRDRNFCIGGFAVFGVLIFLYIFLALIKGCAVESYWEAYASIFDALSGVLNAIVLALLIARLDSKLIGLHSWLISILYSYAAVQPLFIVFELNQTPVWQTITTVVLIFVFLSKVYFFLIIIYALQTGRMLNYLFCFPIFSKKVKESEEASGSQKPESGWLGKVAPLKLSKWIGLVAICLFFTLLVLAAVVPDAVNGLSSVLNVGFDIAHLCAVSVMILILSIVGRKKDSGKHRVADWAAKIFNEIPGPKYSNDADKQLKKFRRYFWWFWVVTIFLYGVFLLDHLHVGEGPPSMSWVEILPRYPPLLVLQGSPSLTLMSKTLFYPFLEFLLGSLNLLFIFRCFVVLQSPAFDHQSGRRQKRLLNYSSFVIPLIIAAFLLLLFLVGGPTMHETDLRTFATLFDGVTGLLSAVALALLIARMDGKLFGLPSRWWSTRILFAYAAIQPLFIAFVMNDDVLKLVQTAVLISAFFLKICLFLIVAHSLQSGKALNYLVGFPFLRDRVDSIFENQFEIKLAQGDAHSFTFSILKKNILYYSATTRFESRKECDAFVDYLRDLMKKRDTYFSPPPQSGTYWVEVRTYDYKLLCESIPLRSKDEAEALIAESMDKIPYCKYNRI